MGATLADFRDGRAILSDGTIVPFPDGTTARQDWACCSGAVPEPVWRFSLTAENGKRFCGLVRQGEEARSARNVARHLALEQLRAARPELREAARRGDPDARNHWLGLLEPYRRQP